MAGPHHIVSGSEGKGRRGELRPGSGLPFQKFQTKGLRRERAEEGQTGDGGRDSEATRPSREGRRGFPQRRIKERVKGPVQLCAAAQRPEQGGRGGRFGARGFSRRPHGLGIESGGPPGPPPPGPGQTQPGNPAEG